MSVLFVCVGVVFLSLFAVLSCLLSLLLVLTSQGERKGNGEKAQPPVFINATHTTRTEREREEEVPVVSYIRRPFALEAKETCLKGE